MPKQIDIYESFALIKNAENKNEIDKFVPQSEKFASQGFREDDVADLLCLNGCSRENAKKLASASKEHLPENYNFENPPESFYDVRDKIHQSLKTAALDKIQVYVTKYLPVRLHAIPQQLTIARAEGSDSKIEDIAQDLKPFIDDVFLTNHAIVASEEKVAELTEKEKLEQDLFGIWPVVWVLKRASIESADKKILKRVGNGDNISFI